MVGYQLIHYRLAMPSTLVAAELRAVRKARWKRRVERESRVQAVVRIYTSRE
jgi:hypothetical protein